MSISGHKTESMFRRYNISTTADKLEALRLRRKIRRCAEAPSRTSRSFSDRKHGHNTDTRG